MCPFILGVGESVTKCDGGRGVSKSVTSSFICVGACFPSLSNKKIPPFLSVQGREIEADRRLFQAMSFFVYKETLWFLDPNVLIT